MTNITAENSGIRARFKNVLDFQQCKHLIRQNERGNIEHSKAANDPKNFARQRHGSAGPRWKTVFGAAFQRAGDGGTGTFEYLCAGPKMSR